MRRINVNSIMQFIVFFMLIGFVVTCNFMLFGSFFDWSEQEVKNAAIVTFVNVLFMSLIFCVFDAIRRYQTITKPVKRIQEGIERVIKGDFSTRIVYIHGEDSGNDAELWNLVAKS